MLLVAAAVENHGVAADIRGVFLQPIDGGVWEEGDQNDIAFFEQGGRQQIVDGFDHFGAQLDGFDLVATIDGVLRVRFNRLRHGAADETETDDADVHEMPPDTLCNGRADFLNFLDKFRKCLGQKRLRTVAKGVFWIVVDFDDQSVRSCCGGSQRHRRHEFGDACGMAWIDDDWQMAHAFDDGNRRNVQRVPRGGFECADAAFAEDDVRIAAGHDVFRAHEELLYRVGEAAFKQDWLVRRAKLLQKFEILHVAGADLNDIDVCEQIQLGDIHDFRDDGQPCDFLCFEQQFDAVLPQPLEGVWRCVRLECAAAQKRRAAFLDGHCDLHDLLL